MADIALLTADKIEVVESNQQLTVIAGEVLTAGDICRLDANGKAVDANGGAAGTADAVGMATRTVKAGEAITLLRRGVIDGLVLDALAYGAKLFLSNTAGRFGDVAGTVSVIVGRVIPALSQKVTSAADKVFLLEINS